MNSIFHKKNILIKLTLGLLCIVFANAHACWTELHSAVLQQKQVTEIESIITRPELSADECESLLNQQDKFSGQTPLHLAVELCSEEIIKLLLIKFHVRQNIRDFHGFYPIHYAASAGDTLSAILLLQHGATLNALSTRHESPLLIAARNSKIPTALFFLDLGANPNIADDNGWTPLHWSIMPKNNRNNTISRLTRRLLWHDAWITTQNSDGATAEDYANEPSLSYIRLFHRKHMLAHDQMLAFISCLHWRLSRNSPACEAARQLLQQNRIEYIYRLLKHNYYRHIERVSSDLI